MRLNINGTDRYFDKEDTFVAFYPNDILNGIYWENEDDYMFISAHIPPYSQFELAKRCYVEDIPFYEMLDVDLSEPPHCWVVSALGRTIASAAEQIANGGTANGE